MEAATMTATAKHGKPSHSNDTKHFMQITTPRQARFISAILHEPKTTMQLRDIVQCGNIWEVCYQLRGRGWDIETLSEPHTDQDGENSRISWYILSASQIPAAHEALEAFYARQQEKKEQARRKSQKEKKA